MKKFSKAFIVALALCLTGILVFTPQQVSAKSKVVKVKSVKLNKKSVKLAKGKKVKLSTRLNPAKTTQKTLVWTSSKKSVATVDKKGTVAARKAGKTQITVTVKGTKVKAKCSVTVTCPVTKVTLTGENKVKEGASIILKAKVTPKDATNKKVTFKSSDNTIATVDSKGIVKGIKAGTVNITATAKDGSKKKAVKKITVVKNQGEEPVTPGDDNTNITVTTQDELNKALENIKNGILTIKTNEETTFVIPEGIYNGVSLAVEGDNANVINNARFDFITIKKQINATFTENVGGNTITVESEKADIIVGEQAVTSISILDSVNDIKIREKGTVSKIDIKGNANVDIIKLNDKDTVTDVNVSGKALIVTNKNINVMADDKITLILKPGAEKSTVTVPSEDIIPDIQGTDKVKVIADGKESEITPSPVEDKYLSDIEFTGKLEKAGTDVAALEGKAYLVRYSDNMNIESADTAEDVMVCDIKDDTYNFNVKEGIYVLMVKVDGYKKFIQIITVKDNGNGAFTNETATLVKESTAKTSSITGKIVNSVNKEPIEGITVEIRRYKNVSDEKVIATTMTNADGEYIFDNIEGDNYTLTVVDNRKEAGTKFITVSFNVCVDNDGSVSKVMALSEQMNDDNVRFVLTWGSQAEGVCSDLDAYIVAPTREENKYTKIYHGEKAYTYNGIYYTQLDIDNMDYEGPETITINNPLDGKYYYYVCNYSKDGKISTSDARVDVYKGSSLIDSYTPGSACDSDYWGVLIYDSTTDKITAVNESSDVGADYKYGLNCYSEYNYTDVEEVSYVYSEKTISQTNSNFIELTSGYLTLKKLLQNNDKFSIKLKNGDSISSYEIYYKGEENFRKYCGNADMDAILYFENNGTPMAYGIQYSQSGDEELVLEENDKFDLYYDNNYQRELEIDSDDESFTTLKSILDKYRLILKMDDELEFDNYEIAYKGDELFEQYGGKSDSDAVVIFKEYSEDIVFQIQFEYDEW